MLKIYELRKFVNQEALKMISNNKGQAVTQEYIVMFFLAIGAVIAMTVYVQRALQARIHAVNIYMINEASIVHGDGIRSEYEPYYGKVETLSDRSQNDRVQLYGPGVSGIFYKTVNQESSSQTKSEQTPPKDYQ